MGYLRFLLVARVGLVVARLIKAPPLMLSREPIRTFPQSIWSRLRPVAGIVEKAAWMAEARITAPINSASKPRIAAGLISNPPPSLVAFHSPVRRA